MPEEENVVTPMVRVREFEELRLEVALLRDALTKVTRLLDDVSRDLSRRLQSCEESISWHEESPHIVNTTE